MGRKIICEKCESSFKFEIAKNLSACPVCTDVWNDEEVSAQKEKTTYYYYKEGGGMLDETLVDQFTPLYTFEAVDLEDAKRQLKAVLPSSPLLNNAPKPPVTCPRCFGTEIQLVPRRYSLLTGFATNQYDRMCLRCQKRF